MGYYTVNNSVEGSFWFVGMATIEALTCRVIFFARDKVYTLTVVGYLCLANTVFIFIGWALYWHGYPGTVNNFLGLLVMVAQVLAMLWRVSLDAGLDKCYTHRRIFRNINIRLRKRDKKMQKQASIKKAKTCQE